MNLCIHKEIPCIEIAGWIIIKHRNGCSINGIFAVSISSLDILLESLFPCRCELFAFHSLPSTKSSSFLCFSYVGLSTNQSHKLPRIQNKETSTMCKRTERMSSVLTFRNEITHVQICKSSARRTTARIHDPSMHDFGLTQSDSV